MFRQGRRRGTLALNSVRLVSAVPADTAVAALIAPDICIDTDLLTGPAAISVCEFSPVVDVNPAMHGRHGTHGVAKVAHAMLSHAHGPVATVPSA
jgi:hypothetical protein